MSLDTVITILSAVIGVICLFGYFYFSENVKLKYKDQRVGK